MAEVFFCFTGIVGFLLSRVIAPTPELYGLLTIGTLGGFFLTVATMGERWALLVVYLALILGFCGGITLGHISLVGIAPTFTYVGNSISWIFAKKW